MLKHTTYVRVRYAETDQMGYAYYGRYAEFFEVARADMMREVGIPYTEMEREYGVMLPVRELNVVYHRPARYDDRLNICTEVREFPSVRMRFDHRVLNDAGELLAEGHVTLVFVAASTMRPTRPPQYFVERLQALWNAPN